MIEGHAAQLKLALFNDSDCLSAGRSLPCSNFLERPVDSTLIRSHVETASDLIQHNLDQTGLNNGEGLFKIAQ